MAEKEELASYLCLLGLDKTEFWLSQLEKHGVQSKASLAYLEGDKTTFSQLEKEAEFLAEKKALQKLLKIDELEEKEKEEKATTARATRASNREIAKEKSQKIKEELHARNEEAKKVLKELQEARTEGMKRTDNKVQALEQELLDRLQIDSNSWISKDKSLDDIIKKLEEHCEISEQFQAREWLDEKVLLQKCSSGRALQGILVSNIASDLLEDRSLLMEPPEHVVLTGANQSLDKIVQFSSSHQEDEFKKAVDILGHSIAASGSTPIFGGVVVTADVSSSDQKENVKPHELHTEKTYLSTVKFSTVQVASYSFERKDLQLSNDAQDNLKELSKLIKVEGQGKDGAVIQQACEKFFRTFGSHVNRGPLSFGGKFCWTCSSKGFSKNRRQTVVDIQSNAVSASAGVSFAGSSISTEVSMEKTKGYFEGKKAEDIFSCTSFQVRIDGGPPETTDLSLWKKGLVANNSTWILIDRGKKLVPVWEIIKINHNKEFGDIREVLRSAWEKMTGLKSEPDVLSVLSYDSDEVLQQVSEWNKDEQVAPQEIQDRLEYLLKVKSDIIDKTTDKSYWISEYLSYFEIQDLIVSLIDSQSCHIKSLLQQLVEEDELKLLDTLVFPSIELVSEYFHKLHMLAIPARPEENIADFEQLDKFLTKTLEDGRIAELENEEFDISTKVSKAIKSLQSHCLRTYNEILISILLYPYQNASFDGVMTLKPMSLNDLGCLLKSFSEQKKKLNTYINKTSLHLQAYLFFTTVEQQHDLIETSPFHEHLQQLSQFMGQIAPVEGSVLRSLNAYLRGGSLRVFKRSLHALMNSSASAQARPLRPSRPVSSANSLMSILKTAAQKNGVIAKDFSLALKSNPNACALLEKLGLSEYYPNGLGLQDALCIRPDPLQLSLNNKLPTDPKQLPYLILHKLMSYDPLCMSDLMPACQTSNSVQQNDDFDDFDDFDDKKEDAASSTGIHPVDSLLALIMCSDDFLRQDLLSRLAKCQLAIPLLLPDPFSSLLALPLWAMRTIVKEWKSTNSSKEVVQQTCPIVSYGMPVVSFVRFGKCQDHGTSKSKTLNDVISDSHYDHFFHRDCPGGQQLTLLGRGLVDMCWCLPSGQPSDAFSDAVTFLNLHGDAREHPHQCRFLSQISSMFFVLLTEKDVMLDSHTMETLKAFGSCPGGITILNDVDAKPIALKRAIPKIRLIQLRERNASKVKDAIRTHIKTNLAEVNEFRSIEDLCVIQDGHIAIDEHGLTFSKGLQLANRLKSIVTTHSTKKPSLKDAMLPLQGKDLWKLWAANDKELYRQTLRGKKTVNDYTAEIEGEKKAIRDQQLEHVTSLSPVMKSFLTSLLKLGGSHNTALRNYYIQCLKLELNNLSRESIGDMQHQYHSTRKALAILKAESEPQEGKCKELKMKLEELQEDIIDSSFGLEHLFRELGQVYEAALASRQYDKARLARLPKAAAELMIDGYPLELMDGDAAHVPLEWVIAVLEQAVQILDNPKVFVLSVLGLQSTGKSTMLNTAFGLQFNVSAGRCTRGAFMQLIPLDEALREKTKCRYVLVVDTEGLRAPELDPLKTQKHDNELATFVIGLANMTLINIYGEVAGDMDDILQTSVHAFLRMTQVKYNPSCQFVHQNAGANLNSEVGRAKFTQKLNQFTIDAAKEENCVGKFKCFNDVIKFDDQSDVHHFPGLWKGDPPMAPVNQGYSYSAQMLKQHFIQYICRRASKNENVSTEKSIGDLSLSSFHGRIKDLWKTLLKEKFVFSFKNTLEITAYNSLETAYGKWEWKFRQAMLDWERKAENKIDAAAVQDVPKLVNEKRLELLGVADKVLQPIKEEMQAFFSGKQSETLAQWKAKFERRLENLAVELKSHAEKLCIQLKKSKEVISKFQSDREKYTKIITRKVYELIASIKKEQEKFNESLQERELKPKQLKKILERNVFTAENVMTYKEHDIITEDQRDQINSIIQSCEGQLTEVHLSKIIVGGILGTEQLKKILKKGRQTKTDLKKRFDQIWIDLINNLDVDSGEQVDVEAEIVEVLISKVKGYDGQLIATLQEKKSLREWGDNSAFVPEEEKHYCFVFREKAKKVLQLFIWWGSSKKNEKITIDAHQKKVIEITERITAKACLYLESVTKKDTDFNATYVQDILHKVDELIKEEELSVKDTFTFTQEYKHVVYLIVCGFAVPEFEKMITAYKKRNDPRLYLEKNVKGPLFAKFENQYNQTEAEEAIANTLCSYLEEPIKSQIEKTLGSIMVDKMKSDERHFENKMALKVKILIDLHKEDKFSSYMSYVANVRSHLVDRLQHYTLEYCDKETSTGNSRLQIQAKEQVSRLIKLVENTVMDVDEPDIKRWLSTFCGSKKLGEEFGISLSAEELQSECDNQHEWNPENFKERIGEGLTELKTKLHGLFDGIKCEDEMKKWKKKPHEILVDLVGCTEQCPFCGEQCDWRQPDHLGDQKHKVEVHRPDCLIGYRLSWNNCLSPEFCPALVAGDQGFISNEGCAEYSNYQSVYPDWSIPSDRPSENCLFWKWFIGKYSNELVDKFHATSIHFPSEWRDIPWEEVECNLNATYKL